MNRIEINDAVDRAMNGSEAALGMLLEEVQDIIFNLSLRMLGTIPDAEDATQEILICIMTKLTFFRKESSFTTWVYRIAVNYLLNYKKSLFSAFSLSFEYFAQDIEASYMDNTDEIIERVDKTNLAEELKLSCTNVMLQCFDPENRCIFILGTMFKVNSNIASEILHITPEVYRKRLSRAKQKMTKFLSHYCSLSGTGSCYCKNRIHYAMDQKRLNPKNLEYSKLKNSNIDTLALCKKEMEQLDDLSDVFETLEIYKSPVLAKQYLCNLLKSAQIQRIKNF